MPITPLRLPRRWPKSFRPFWSSQRTSANSHGWVSQRLFTSRYRRLLSTRAQVLALLATESPLLLFLDRLSRVIIEVVDGETTTQKGARQERCGEANTLFIIGERVRDRCNSTLWSPIPDSKRRVNRTKLRVSVTRRTKSHAQPLRRAGRDSLMTSAIATPSAQITAISRSISHRRLAAPGRNLSNMAAAFRHRGGGGGGVPWN